MRPTFAFAFFVFASNCGERAGRDADPSKGTPTRVLSQTVLSDEILFDLGPEVQARVVGVSSMADDTRYAVPRAWPRELPRVGGSAERLLALAPDFVVLAGFTAEETKAMLRRADVPYLELQGFDAFEDYRRHVSEIARAVGADDAGEKLLGSFDERLAAVVETASVVKSRGSVVSWDDGIVPGAKTTFDEAATIVGLENLGASKGGLVGHGEIDLATLITWDPTFVVLSCHPGACEQAGPHFRALPGTGAMAAVKEDRLVTVETPVLLSTGRSLLDLVERLDEATR